MGITISNTRNIKIHDILKLYRANGWSAANKPSELYQALMNSHTLISAWREETLVGLGNAISDGHLVVYYPHLLVHPDYQGKGTGQLFFKKCKTSMVIFICKCLQRTGKL